jgi:hypothetical protein
MNKPTLPYCLTRASELGVRIYGDTSLRGKCNAEDGELSSFHQWVIFNYPEFAPMCFHPANEWKPDNNKESHAHYQKMLNKGYMPRLADWIFLGANGMPPFLLEMKKKHISESLNSRDRKEHFLEQCELLHRQQKLGAVVCIALGFEAAKVAWIEYLEKYYATRKAN